MSGVMTAGAESMMMPFTLLFSLERFSAVQSLPPSEWRAANDRNIVPKKRKPALLQQQHIVLPCDDGRPLHVSGGQRVQGIYVAPEDVKYQAAAGFEIRLQALQGLRSSGITDEGQHDARCGRLHSHSVVALPLPQLYISTSSTVLFTPKYVCELIMQLHNELGLRTCLGGAFELLASRSKGYVALQVVFDQPRASKSAAMAAGQTASGYGCWNSWPDKSLCG